MLTIRLPWPDKRLSPNARLHYQAVARVKKAARHDACFSAIAATTPAQRAALKRAESLDVAVTFCPPSRRAFDDDNLVASIKAHIDGIADALGVDDSRWRLTIERGEPVKGGAVIVEVFLHSDTEASNMNAERAGAGNADPLLTETALRRRA